MRVVIYDGRGVCGSLCLGVGCVLQLFMGSSGSRRFTYVQNFRVKRIVSLPPRLMVVGLLMSRQNYPSGSWVPRDFEVDD